MPKIPLTGGAYEARSVIADAQRCVNLYPEQNAQDAEVPLTHYPTPGLIVVALGQVGGDNPPTPGGTKVYIPPGTTSWTVPVGVGLLISIELWGAGGDGGYNAGSGGGYTSVGNVPVTPGQVFALNIPVHNPSVPSQPLTWFDSPTTYCAQSGGAGDTFSGGLVGLAANGIGDIKFSGGAGSSGFGGGGGAGGPDGDGAAGGNAGGVGSTPGAGGGGSNGGGAGHDNTQSGNGGDGGTNHAGQSGGLAPGGNAANPGAGGGGAGLTPSIGGNGADDQDKGGGGGGGGPGFNPGTIGGNGGFPGGGGGGARFGTAGGTAGDGQIKITY